MATDASQRPDIFYPSWQNEYEAALLEPEPEKLSARVKAAEIAIYERLQNISQSADHLPERQVIQEALAVLRVLQTDELNYPDWENHATSR